VKTATKGEVGAEEEARRRREEIMNLKVICRSIDAHNESCEFPLARVVMSPLEVVRLDWDEIKGVPVQADERKVNGKFWIVCSAETHSSEKAPGELLAA
jgi:hypothetical protein